MKHTVIIIFLVIFLLTMKFGIFKEKKPAKTIQTGKPAYSLGESVKIILTNVKDEDFVTEAIPPGFIYKIQKFQDGWKELRLQPCRGSQPPAPFRFEVKPGKKLEFAWDQDHCTGSELSKVTVGKYRVSTEVFGTMEYSEFEIN